VALLFVRACKDTVRKRSYLLLRGLVTVGQGVLFGLVMLGLKADFAGTQTLLGYSLSAPAIGSLSALTAGIACLWDRKAATIRELKSHLYSPSAFSLSSFAADAPAVLLFSLAFAGTTYFIPPLPGVPAAACFFFFYLTVCILGGYFAALAHFFTALAPTQQTAQAAGGFAIGVSLLFSGLFIPQPLIPPGWLGMHYAVPSTHTLRAVATAETFCRGTDYCPSIVVPGLGVLSVSQYVDLYLGFTSTTQFLFNELGWAALAVAAVLVCAAARHRFPMAVRAAA